MTYACVVFAHTKVVLLQRDQNQFLRMASGCPWYIRNLDLHKDVELELFKEFCKHLAKRYYERADSHSNPLIAEACKSAPHLHPLLQRPRSVLVDPDQLLPQTLST